MVATLVVVLLVSVVAFLALYALIERETADPRVTDRKTAQREAMAQGGRPTDADGTGNRNGDGAADVPERSDGRAGRERR